MDKQSRKNYHWIYFVSALIAISGIIMGDWRTIPEGMRAIFFSNAILITDYVALAGIAAAFLNVALVTLFSAILLRLSHMPMHGRSFFTLGLMSGFAFFGKNVFTMWAIIFGSYIYSVLCKEKFSKYIVGGLLATSLGPIVGVAYLYGGVTPLSITVAAVIGIVIGVVVSPLAGHTNGILRGLSLYNSGFAVGLLALVVVPVMIGFGFPFENESSWATGYNLKFSIFLYLAAITFIACGYFSDKKHAIKNYFTLLKRPGVGKDDFTQLDGMGAVLINMGVNIIICTTYVLAIGGDLNGGTMGGIFTIVGFSANGKNARNIVPIILGVCLGAIVNPSVSPQTPGIQMAVFLGTSLAPMAGTYGFMAGIIVGMAHSFAVLKTGLSSAGANLYNNGFCAGVISVTFYPIFDKFFGVNTFSEPSPSRAKASEKQIEAKEIKV